MELIMAGIDREWLEDALCRRAHMYPDMFEDYGPNVIEAKRACAMCPVKKICLAEHIDEPWGIWGGLNTPERALYKEGLPILYCETCGSTMTRKVGDQCMACQHKPITAAALVGSAERIADLATEGKTDTEIAKILCVELSNQDILPAHVQSIRRRNGIVAGSRKNKETLKNEFRKRSAGRLKTYSVVNVDHAEWVGHGSLGELTGPERVELLRRWLAKGGTRTTFMHHYKCSSTVVKKLLALTVGDLGERDVS